jgi:acetyl esterase
MSRFFLVFADSKPKTVVCPKSQPMKKFKFIPLTICFLAASLMSVTASNLPEQDTIPAVEVFKKIDTLNLHLNIYRPDGFNPASKHPAIIFFFGGGWVGGSTKQFHKQSLYFASRGMVAVTAEYRVSSRNKTTPFEAVADAKSAIRFLRDNATRLGIDPKRIAAAGGSAGGHLAAAADLTKLDEPSENLKVSSRPNALILFNPVFNNGPGEYGYDRIGERYPEISPYHNIREGAAPTVVFLGTKDKLVSVHTAKSYQSKMIENRNRCELFLYEGQVHGFFNTGEYYLKTVREADIFLESLGYIRGKPTL